ncbi:hypothetical protein CFO_g5565 [Ceratocystis platani]|uniref:Uncharacterized protein n=1 Tax=Ceratocystis fimbriata f. sp. platani TaxID=88771 RepID=A0A0F8AW76_CERFI|nr:hypothetical protein CFO_g5565 [Ceratocystis platani]
MSARPNPPSSPDSFESFSEEVASHTGAWFEYFRSLFSYADEKEAEIAILNHTMTTESANFTAVRDSLTANFQATRGQLDHTTPCCSHCLLFLSFYNSYPSTTYFLSSYSSCPSNIFFPSSYNSCPSSIFLSNTCSLSYYSSNIYVFSSYFPLA